MSISVESTKSKIIISIIGETEPLILQRAFHADSTVWLTYTDNGFIDISQAEEPIEPLPVESGDLIDSFELTDGLYEYRYVKASITDPEGKDYKYSTWVKFGNPKEIGYSFGNYKSPEGEWGEILTPDDCRFTYLWGTDFKATNGSYFTDEQIKWFIDAALKEVERQLNITIKKRVIKSQDSTENLVKGVDYDDEEALYDFSYRKIQRYGMIQTKQRPILRVTKCKLFKRGFDNDMDLLNSIFPDKKQGVIKFLKRPFMLNDTYRGIQTSLGRYGQETYQPNLFYAIDYEAGFEKSEDVPIDLRQIVGKVAAISLLNIIGDGLMSGFSSSSLSMDGISESFSSTQSATSAYFGARIKVYQDEVKDYIKENKYRFGFTPIGCL